MNTILMFLYSLIQVLTRMMYQLEVM